MVTEDFRNALMQNPLSSQTGRFKLDLSDTHLLDFVLARKYSTIMNIAAVSKPIYIT